jgi:PII-like signaling protein
MTADALKLTTYFGERDRTPEGLLGDELLGLYARHEIRTSVLLRGAEGFGAHHRLSTGRLLTLSEDLPVVSVAVDRRARVEALVEPVLQLQRRGLVTLERARLLDRDPSDGDPSGVELPLAPYEASKLTIYLGRRARVRGAPAFVAVCELLHGRGLDGASVLLGVDGTRQGERARAHFFSRNADVPVMVIAVGAAERIAAVLPELAALIGEAPLTLERVRMCKRDGRLLARPHDLPAVDAGGQAVWQKLMVYTSQSATHRGRPPSWQIVRGLREAGVAGATTLHGIWGFHGAHGPHGDRLLQVRRRVPALTVVVDVPERIARAFSVIDELTAEHGLVTSEMVPALRAGNAERASAVALDLAEHGF